jgi:hypothetical protein
MKDLKFIEKRENRKSFVGRKVLPFLSKKELHNVKGGQQDKEVTPCDPWSDCDAWHCAPDCVCKSNLA